MKLVIMLIALTFSIIHAHQPQNLNSWFAKGKQDLQVELSVPINKVKSVVQDLKKRDFDIAYANHKTGEIHVLLNQEDFNTLKNLYPQLSVRSSSYVSLSPDDEYKTYTEIVDIIQKTKNQYPHLIQIQSFGKTLEGRDIIAVRISDDKEFNKQEPSVLFNALHHAREVMTVEIIQDILESLTKGYSRNENIKAWVEKLQIWLIPMVNPDGSNKVWTTDTMWRKNTRSGHGVDINRNYPYKWGECNGSSTNPNAQDYRGPSAASEPETKTMMNFIETVKPIYNISYHAYGEMVIHPFGCRGLLPNPADQVVETAKALGSLVKYSVGASWQLLYDVDGGDLDWMYAVHHVIPFVFEVSTRGDGFQPSYERRDPVVKQNKVGWQYLLAKASGVGLNQFNATRAKLQLPMTINWNGKWYVEAEKRHRNNNSNRRSPSNRQNHLIVKILNSQKKVVVEHLLVPTKNTQHYLLDPGSYQIQVKSSTGQSVASQNFEVNSDTNNQVSI